MAKKPSWAAVKRLPKYFRYLSELEEAGEKKTSSGALAELMGLTASQVRQDLNYFGGFGQQGYGYNVSELRESIREILRLNDRRTAILVGAGNLGRALMSNFDFESFGFSLMAAFDVDERIVGSDWQGVPVLHTSQLCRYLESHAVDVGILALPRTAARETARLLANAGVKGIWNFTNTDLHLELPDMPVENAHFSEGLMVLSYQL